MKTKSLALAIAIMSHFALSGGSCNPDFDSSALHKPAKRCLVPPEPISRLMVGQDLVEKHIELGDKYNSVASRLRCTQRYIKTVTK